MFEYPKILFFLLLTPLFFLVLLYDIFDTKKKVAKIAGKNIGTILPYYSEGQKWLKLIFYTTAYVFLVLAIARPRWGVEEFEAKIKGRDIYLIVDVSNSMAVQDTVPSRLELVKINIRELMKLDSTDRYGLIAFTDESVIVSPLTHDYYAIEFFLDSIYPGMIGEGGTNIADAINNAVTLLKKEATEEKVSVLITDGEALTGNIKSAIKRAKDEGIKIFTVGVGTEEGKLIPIKNDKGETVDYIKDSYGRPVRSKLDSETLKEIARETGGYFFGVISGKNFLVEAFKNLKTRVNEYGAISSKQKVDRYPIFVIPAIFLLVMGFILDQGKIIKVRKDNFSWLVDKKIFFIFVILLFSSYVNLVASDLTEDTIKSKTGFGSINGGFWGNRSFKKGNYQKALQQYKSAIGKLKNELESRLYYNIGNTFYMLNDLKNAVKNHETAASLTEDKELLAKIFYNQALALFKQGDYKTSLELFKKSLKYNDKDDDTRYNYAVCKLLAENENNKNESDKDKKSQGNQQKENSTNQDKSLTKEEIEAILKALEQKETEENQNKRKNIRIRYW